MSDPNVVVSVTSDLIRVEVALRHAHAFHDLLRLRRPMRSPRRPKSTSPPIFHVEDCYNILTVDGVDGVRRSRRSLYRLTERSAFNVQQTVSVLYGRHPCPSEMVSTVSPHIWRVAITIHLQIAQALNLVFD